MQTIYKYNEELGDLFPSTFTAPYEKISNKEKNKIITIANSKKYYTSHNLSDEEFFKILEIILLNDETNIKEIINNGKYTLKNYYLSNGQIYFNYIQEGHIIVLIMI